MSKKKSHCAIVCNTYPYMPDTCSLPHTDNCFYIYTVLLQCRDTSFHSQYICRSFLYTSMWARRYSSLYALRNNGLQLC